MAKSLFEPAFHYAFGLEKGVSTHAADRGGVTADGISLELLKLLDLDVNGDGIISDADIFALSFTQKREIYRKVFWEKYRLEEIEDQDVASRVFSIFVHTSPANAGKIVQKALLANLRNVVVDGILGSKSFAAINSCPAHSLLPAIRMAQAAFYEQLVARDPSQQVFLKGWLNRAYAF